MHLDLVDHLRCPRAHPDVTGGVALVCVPQRVDGRTLHEAMLGCAVCHARFTVVGGAAWFGEGDAPRIAAGESSTHKPDELLWLAAMLNLDGPGGLVLLDAAWAGHAVALARDFAVGVVVLVAAPVTLEHPMVSVLSGPLTSLPLAPAVLRGAAFGARTSEPLLRSAATALMPNGRLVAPVECDLPPAIAELARDDRHWVAEPRAAPVSLRRAPPPPTPRTPGQ